MSRKCFFLLILCLSMGPAGAQSPDFRKVDSMGAIGDFQGAITALASLKLNTPAVQLRYARAYEAQGNPTKALEYYRKVLSKDPDRLLAAVALGKLLSKTGNLEEADSLFTGLVKQYPRNGGFHYQLGLVREKRNDSTALDHFIKTTVLSPTHQVALYKVAKFHLSRGRYARAEKLSRQGLQVNPYNPGLLSLLAQVQFHQKEYQLAVTTFDKLVRLGHASEFIYLKLGFSYLQMKEYEAAIRAYQGALLYEEGNSQTHHVLGKIFARTGKLEESEKHLLLALLLKNQAVDAEYLSLALTYKLKKQFQKAMKYVNQAIEENPDNERAWFERAIIADSYYKDLAARENYYQAYLKRFDSMGDPRLTSLAEVRIRDIRKERHLNK